MFNFYLFICNKQIFIYSFNYIKNNSPILNLSEENFTYFNIKKIINQEERQKYLKNKTEFYLNKRTKYLLNNPYNNLNCNGLKIIIIQDKLNWLAIKNHLYINHLQLKKQSFIITVKKY